MIQIGLFDDLSVAVEGHGLEIGRGEDFAPEREVKGGRGVVGDVEKGIVIWDAALRFPDPAVGADICGGEG